MSDAYEKTEAPTPRRRAEARRDGRVARSADLVAAAVLLSAIVLMSAATPKLIAAFRALLESALSQPGQALSVAEVSEVCKVVGVALVPLSAGVVVIAIIANLLQFGLIWRFPFRADALDIGKGWQRIFSPRSRMRVLIDLAKLALVAWLASSLLRHGFGRIIALQQSDVTSAFAAGGTIIHGMALRIALLLLTLAVLDYACQRWLHERELRMTRQEIKDELRQSEGDPQIRRIRRGGIFPLPADAKKLAASPFSQPFSQGSDK